jgi:type IV secretory pathway TrbD component
MDVKRRREVLDTVIAVGIACAILGLSVALWLAKEWLRAWAWGLR